MKVEKKAASMAWIFALLLGSDLMIKQYVEENLTEGEEIPVIGDKLVLRKVYNRGFMLNLLDKKPELVQKASVFTAAGMLLYGIWVFKRKGHRLEKAGLLLAGAGGASNLYDRLVRGQVVDYIGIRCKHPFLSRLTANLGDVYLLLGAVLASVPTVGGAARSGKSPRSDAGSSS